MPNGSRMPVLFDYDVNSKQILSESIYLCNKKLMVHDLKEFRFGLYTSDLKDYFHGFDLKKDPLTFTLVILYN